MAKVSVNFKNRKALMKPMHGVGQPPFSGSNFSMVKYLKDAGIPYSRLHDVGGPYGQYRWVDIPNIFRDFQADPFDPASYDFAFTDILINALVENEVEPFFRLGVTIENDAGIRAYRIYPPEDYHKWAVICEHIIRHYTEGWASGFFHKITYWEIWNEPDNGDDIDKHTMWKGTKEQFYELYEEASKHLKKCFPHLKIGGYGSCGFYSILDCFEKMALSSQRTDYFLEFFDDFLKYVKKYECPLDFFSWHSYGTVKDNMAYASYARKRLDEEGFYAVENICNEWNSKANTRGSFEHAAETCAVLLAFQDLPLDSAMFYDARWGVGIYGGLFHPMTKEPFPAYYAFTAFNRLYKLKNQVLVDKDSEDIYVVGAVDGTKGCVVIANPVACTIALDFSCMGGVTGCLLTADGQIETEVTLPKELPPYSILTIEVEL